jgi:hypothetical protein
MDCAATEPHQFFSRRGANFISRRPGVGVELATLNDGEDWLYRPVLRGLMKAESLLDPGIDLTFIADLNDAIDVQDENDYRLAEASK